MSRLTFYEKKVPLAKTFGARKFTIAEVIRMTNNFSASHKIGDGYSYSGTFYKGVLSDGTLLAVWRSRSDDYWKDFGNIQAEFQPYKIQEHPNLLQIVGGCVTSNECFVVYPYMSNGSLRSQLQMLINDHGQPVLSFKMRKHIALGVAKGLAYLHGRSPMIVHQNVNSGAILLDDEYEAMVVGFPFRKVIHSLPMSRRGTIGYIRPEYYDYRVVSVKNDIYSYGVLLLELITARDPQLGVKDSSDSQHAINLVDWVQKLAGDDKLGLIVDSNLKKDNMIADIIDINNLLKVALLCTKLSSSTKPKMSEVVSMLENEEFLL